MKRLFLGVPISSDRAFQAVQIWKKDEALKSNVLKWANHENWHITLVFLGITPESAIPLIQKQIENIFTGISAFNARLFGLGLFPNSNHPKVLWLGIDDFQLLIPAANRMKDLLQQTGFSIDNKPLKPHLTLARIKNATRKNSINLLIDQYQHFNFGTVDISRVILYESLSTSDGPIYKPIFQKNLD